LTQARQHLDLPELLCAATGLHERDAAMLTDSATDELGSLTVTEPAPGVLEVVVRGKLSPAVGAVFPRYARAAALHQERYSVFLDVRGLKAFHGAVRAAWIDTVREHRVQIDEVVVLSSDLLVTLSARAASVALAAHGLRFDVLTDERRYLDRRSRRVGPFAPAATSAIASVHPAAA
jgi:hypothetical protein